MAAALFSSPPIRIWQTSTFDEDLERGEELKAFQGVLLKI
jgi:hypothetical protein